MRIQPEDLGATPEVKREQRIINLILAAIFLAAVYGTLFVGNS